MGDVAELMISGGDTGGAVGRSGGGVPPPQLRMGLSKGGHQNKWWIAWLVADNLMENPISRVLKRPHWQTDMCREEGRSQQKPALTYNNNTSRCYFVCQAG